MYTPYRQTPALGKHPPVRQTPPGQTAPPGRQSPWADISPGRPLPPEMATATDSTHPTAMYSCYHLQCSCSKVMFSLFTVICHSVHGGGGVSQHALGETPPPRPEQTFPGQTLHWPDTPLGRYPPGRHPPPLGRHPQADTPWTDTPLGRRPLWADTPHPSTATAADGTHPAGMHSCYN